MHFMGWSSKFDNVIDRASVRLQPHHSKVPNWRLFRANDKVEFRKPDGKWHLGSVEKVDRTLKKVLLRLRPTLAATRKESGDMGLDFMRFSASFSPTGTRRVTAFLNRSQFCACCISSLYACV